MAISKDHNDDTDLFKNEVSGIKPLNQNNLKKPDIIKPTAQARKSIEDEEEAKASLLSEFSENEFIETGEELLYYRPGVQKRIVRNLKKGQYSIQAEVDLHGLTSDSARKTLSRFLITCIQEGLTCVLIIHGKGYRSEGNKPVIKSMVNSWLRKRNDILAFCSAKKEDGGTGAIYALLRKKVDY